MALGKIKADTLEHSTAGSVDTQFVVKGSTKAWAKFDTDAVIDEGFNSSSVTDNGTGDFSLSLTNSMSSSLYIALTTCGNAKHCQSSEGSRTSSLGKILTFDNSHNANDVNDLNITFNGDLA